MKFVHIADIHFDSPFKMLSNRSGLGDLMRLKQRETFKKVIGYIQENDISFLFISGDLYEQDYVRKTTIEYINSLFKKIPETQIFISPGNHDPYIKNSYYNMFNWNDNVRIFDSKIEKIKLKDVDIYGYGFGDFYCKNSGIENIEIEDKNKLNILIIHGDLDGGNTKQESYNPMSKAMLKQKGFDYCALGHIHKLNYNTEQDQRIVYPGSLMPLGFDELGEHGIIVGNLEKNKIELNFKKISEIEFEEIEINCTEINSIQELCEKINNLILEKNKLYKIILNGKRNFEINIYNLFKLELNKKIIKIKDKTKPNFELENLVNETTLKGLFTKEMLERTQNAQNEEEKEMLEKAVEIGLEVLE